MRRPGELQPGGLPGDACACVLRHNGVLAFISWFYSVSFPEHTSFYSTRTGISGKWTGFLVDYWIPKIIPMIEVKGHSHNLWITGILNIIHGS